MWQQIAPSFIMHWICTAILFMQATTVVAGTIYDFNLVADGAVIARIPGVSNTAYPSVIRVPSWIAPADRANSSANYYMYYGSHGGKHIRMKWAQTLDGPWTDFDLGGTYNGQSRRGVFDADADATREDYDHVSAPDVHVDDVNQRIIMYFHGERPSTTTSGGTNVPKRHENFVTTSAKGLNFNDPLHAGGETSHGPRSVTVDDITRDIWIGEDYQRAFQKNGDWYSISKRSITNASPNPNDPWAPLAGNPFGEAWTRENTPSALWTNDASAVQDNYHSPGATFLASSEFANHPRNPNPGIRITSNGSSERLNHVGVNLLSPDELEVFFYVRDDPSDRYDDIYRIVYDISDSDFQNWTVARDAMGQVFFDVVLSPEEVVSAVQAVNPGADPTFFADPVSLGDTDIFVDDDGSKYLFMSYVSDVFGGSQGEGQITAVKLTIPTDGDFDFDQKVDGFDFLMWQRGESPNPLSTTDLAAWEANYGAVAPLAATSTAVPEPATGIMLLIGMINMLFRRDEVESRLQ